MKGVQTIRMQVMYQTFGLLLIRLGRIYVLIYFAEKVDYQYQFFCPIIIFISYLTPIPFLIYKLFVN